MGTVYLLHFVRKSPEDPRGVTARYHHAGHYVGFTKDLANRLREHRSGAGANLLRVIQEAGLSFLVVRAWGGVTAKVEQRLKNRGGAARLCPVCNPGTAEGAFRHVPRDSRWRGREKNLMKVRTRKPAALPDEDELLVY